MLENQRCRLFVIRSWAVAASQEVLLTLDIGAKAPLAGNMRIFAQAVDRAGRVASFADFGGWTVQSPPASNSAPAGLYLRPALSNYGFSATIRFEFADPNGAHDIAWVLPVINSSLRGANSCSFEFDRSTNLLWLRNDGDTGWLGPVVAGNAGTIANSQCTIDAGQIRIETEDITLRIFVPVTFATAFRGDKTVYLRAEDASGAGRGWEARGFWFVQ